MAKIHVHKIDYHRNGVSGEGFHVCKFIDSKEGFMIGIVFPSAGYCAVMNIDMLSEGIIDFGKNSYKGDHYEKELRQAIASWGKN